MIYLDLETSMLKINILFFVGFEEKLNGERCWLICEELLERTTISCSNSQTINSALMIRISMSSTIMKKTCKNNEGLEGSWRKRKQKFRGLFLICFCFGIVQSARMNKLKRGIIGQFSMTILFKSYLILQLRLWKWIILFLRKNSFRQFQVTTISSISELHSRKKNTCNERKKNISSTSLSWRLHHLMLWRHFSSKTQGLLSK